MSTVFTDNSNWDTFAPDSDDIAIIPNTGVDPTISGAVTVAQIQINDGGHLTVDSSGVLTVDVLTMAPGTSSAFLTINEGSVTVTTSATLSSTGSSFSYITGSAGGSFILQAIATMTVNSNIASPCLIDVPVITLDGTVNIQSGALVIDSSTPTAGTIHLNSVSNNVILQVVNGTLTVDTLELNPGSSGNAEVSIDTGGTVAIGTSFEMNGSVTHQSLVTGVGLLTLGASGDLDVNVGAGDLPAEIQVGSTFDGDVNVDADGKLSLSNGGTYRVRKTCSVGANAFVRVLGGSILTCETSGQLGGTGSYLVDDDGFLNFDVTQTGTMTLTSHGPVGNHATLSGAADPLFGPTADVTITSGVSGSEWRTQSMDRNAGTMKVQSDGTHSFILTIVSSSNFINDGVILLNGDTGAQPTISGAGILINNAGARLEASGNSGISCAINNMGELRVSGGQLDLSQSYTQNAATALLRVQNGNTLSVSGGNVTLNDGMASVEGTLSAFSNTLSLNGSSVLEGDGLINGDVVNASRIRPGGSGVSGTLTINGNYSQTMNLGVVEIEFTSNSVFDKIVVQGNMTLNHELEFNLVGAYVPTVNTVFPAVFEIPGGQSRTGNYTSFFQNETGKGVYFVPVYNGNDVDFRTKTLAVAVAQSINATPSVPVNGTLTSTDADGDVPTYLIQSQPAKGTVTITNSATGAFTYTANAGATGTDSFLFKVDDGILFSNNQTVTINLTAPPVIASATPSPNPAKVGSTVTFAAVASDPASLPLTYSWDFQDGQPHTMGNPITHVFPNAGNFTVILRVFNGSSLATMNVSVDVLGPNSGAETITNVGDGKDPVTNPLNGIMLSIASSNGGVVELAVDLNALVRESFDVNTGFDTIKGRQNVRKGLRPTEKFVEPGLAVATTIATDAGSTTERGKARRQIAVSSREVGQAPPFTAPPVNRTIETQSMKGKFLFSSTKPDQFTFTGTFELPEGLDVSEERTLEIGIGNVIDAVTISAKGKSAGPTLNRISKAQIKYPKVSKDNPLTTAGQKAKLTLTMKGVNFSSIGFDTEGIAATLRGDEVGLKAVPRAIQTAISFAGSTWEGSIPVDFKLAKKADSGTIQTRRAN